MPSERRKHTVASQRTARAARALFLAGALVSCSRLNAQETVRAVVPPQSNPQSKFVSSAVNAGDYVYISAQDARGPDGARPSNFDAQVRQALDNIKAIVVAAGLTMDNVVYTQVYLTEVSKTPEVDRVFAQYFTKVRPARAVLGVARLPDPPVQINAVAVRDLAGLRPIFPANYPHNDSSSPGVLTRDLLFISGMAGVDPASGQAPDDPAAQVDLALDGMNAVVKAAGLELSHVVFVNPYLTKEIPARVMNEHYARRFEFGNTPARATIEVAGLPGGAHIEYTGVAVRDIHARMAVRPKNMPPSPTASPCVFAGETVYCSAKSGFIPGPHGGVYASSTAAQLRQTMRNLLDNLEEAGMNFSQVVSTTVYLDDLADAQEFDKVYAQYLGPIMPARTTLEQISPGSRTPDEEGHYPDLEQVSLIAVQKHAKP
jgi:enamine deaminase RidA (YjgF/YER057c/UK114 family)